MKTLGIVPARAGSRRVPMKNLRTLGGYSLVELAILCGKASGCLDRIVVSSDSEKVLEISESLIPGSGILRPGNISGHLAPAKTYIVHALEVEAKAGRDDYEAVVILQPTSPFRVPNDVRQTVQALENQKADSAVTVVRVRHDLHPAKFKIREGARLRPLFSEHEVGRTFDELPPVFVRDGGVYVISINQFEQDDFLGGNSIGVEIPAERALDINDELDLAFAEFMWDRIGDSHEYKEFLREKPFSLNVKTEPPPRNHR